MSPKPSTSVFDVRQTAEDLALFVQSIGCAAKVVHSGSKAGKSSYITVDAGLIAKKHTDTEGNEVFRCTSIPEIRVSDHSKGVLMSQFHLHIFDEESLKKVKAQLVDLLGPVQPPEWHEQRKQLITAATQAKNEAMQKVIDLRIQAARLLLQKEADGAILQGKEKREVAWLRHEINQGRIAPHHATL